MIDFLMAGSPQRARAARIVDMLVTALALSWIAVTYPKRYSLLPVHPTKLALGNGWWGYFDQSQTLKATLAFRDNDWSAAHQWYPPLYSALGTVAMWFNPVQPFLLLDLICLLATLLLFAEVGAGIGVPRGLCALVFVAINLFNTKCLDAWILPWNTDLATPIQMLTVLCMLRLSRDEPARACAPCLGLSAGIILAVRPTDLAPLSPALLFVSCRLLARAWAGRAGATPIMFGLLGGLAVGVSISLSLHLAIWGPHPSQYMIGSRDIGFDPHLLWMHWITVVIDPAPVFGDGGGMVQHWPWIPISLAGMLTVACACISQRWTERSAARAHFVVISSIVFHWALYLSYRDLHPRGLWRFNNYHYFTWTLAPLALYGLLFCHAVWRSIVERYWALLAIAGVAACASGLSLAWRVRLVPLPSSQSVTSVDVADNRVTIAAGLPHYDDVLVVSAKDDSPNAVYFDANDRLLVSGVPFRQFDDFRTFPIDGGALVMPLRRLAGSPAVLELGTSTRLQSDPAPTVMRLVARFGWPCWMPLHLAAHGCKPSDFFASHDAS